MEMLPELYREIIARSDGFERENMKLVCKMFNEFKFIIVTNDPARDREVLLLNNTNVSGLFKYGHQDLVLKYLKIKKFIPEGFYMACRYGMLDIVKYYIEELNYNRNYIDMFDVCLREHIHIVKYFLDLNIFVPTNCVRETCKTGNLELVKLLLPKKPPVNENILYGACVSGNRDLIDFVIANGFDNWDEGLSGACAGGHMDLMFEMVERGAKNWDNAFTEACGGGHMNIIEYIVNNHTVNLKDGFFEGCKMGHLEIVKMFDKYCDDFDKIMGLMQCYDHYDVLKYLIETNHMENYDIIMRVASAHGNMDIVKLMIEYGANDWNECLYRACETGNLELAKLMIEHGATDFNGALVRSKGLEIIKMLVELGATELDSCLIRQCRYGDPETVRYLIQKGAKKFTLALMISAREGHTYLLDIIYSEMSKL